MKLIDINCWTMKPWETPVYMAQCATFKIAADLADDHRNATGFDGEKGLMDLCMKPPFCLRVVKACRTPAVQAFRDAVAREARLRKNSGCSLGEGKVRAPARI